MLECGQHPQKGAAQNLKGWYKALEDLVWLTQLGLSVALPLALFLGGAVWLHNSRGWGSWVIWVGLIIGLSSAVSGFRQSLKAMEQMSRHRDKKDPPPISFNEHT